MIHLGSDHAGVKLKEKIKTYLKTLNTDVCDKGAFDDIPIDYPVVAKDVALEVSRGDSLGILVCGSGIGMSIAANKVPGIRAALATSTDMSALARMHNNANVLCLSARLVTDEQNLAIVRAWMEADFEGGRHQRRIDLIHTLEKEVSSI